MKHYVVNVKKIERSCLPQGGLEIITQGERSEHASRGACMILYSLSRGPSKLKNFLKKL